MDFLVWNVDPNIFSVGSITIRWYGLLFALSFIMAIKIMEWVFKKEGKKVEDVDTLLIYMMIGTIAGARLGHCLFYDPIYYFSNPLKFLAVWEGGLASHGGAIGIILAGYLFTKKLNYNFIWLLDRIVIPAVLSGFFIRLGNLFNSEIIGLQSNLPWAIIFQRIDNIPRHPVQVYESITYLIIFTILFLTYKKYGIKLKEGFLFGLFMVTVFTARFLLEFIKVKQASYSNDFGISTGQLLSLPFVILGLYMIFVYKSKEANG